MKIKYLVASENPFTSVGQKARGQLKGFLDNGINADLVFIGFGKAADKIMNISQIELKQPSSNFLLQRRQQKVIHHKIMGIIEENYSKVDFFYLRFPGSSKALWKTAKKYGKKLIIETQSTGFEELESRRRDRPFQFNLSWLLDWWQFYFLPIRAAKKYQLRIFSAAWKVVFVTKEIQEKVNIPNSLLIPNGFEEPEYVELAQPAISEKQTWLFLKGSSGSLDYDGLDRIIASMDKSNFKENITLRIAGKLSKSQQLRIKNKTYIEALGFLNKDEVIQQLKLSHLGIGTMSLYKKNLNEASALKVRQYAYHGLPFVIGYHDSDISEIDAFKGYFMQVSNDNSELPITEIYNWAKKANTIENRQELSELSLKHLSWTSKMKVLINALQ